MDEPGHEKIFLAIPKNKLSLQSQNRTGAIAQLVEQRTENPCVPGSIPGGTTKTSRLLPRAACFGGATWHSHLRGTPPSPRGLWPGCRSSLAVARLFFWRLGAHIHWGTAPAPPLRACCSSDTAESQTLFGSGLFATPGQKEPDGESGLRKQALRRRVTHRLRSPFPRHACCA